MKPIHSSKSSLSKADVMALAEQNPEEFCLIKCTKITTGASTNNTDNNCVDTNSQEEEKR